jgi:phosphoglycolate phosphatase-like HAD superfamily hydrolase
VKLVLFDIDGTIMLSAGAGNRAVRRALVEVFGGSGPEKHRFDGKTDPQIVRELMSMAGHGDLQCGAALGCTAIGVATGMYSLDDLREHRPAAVFPNLADTPSVVRAILGDGDA